MHNHYLIYRLFALLIVISLFLNSSLPQASAQTQTNLYFPIIHNDNDPCDDVPATIDTTGGTETSAAIDTTSSTPTVTMTATATATNTLSPTVMPTFTSTPTPEVVIPDGFQVHVDEEYGYSIAYPSGWADLDLNGQPIQRMAMTLNVGDILERLNGFLDSEQSRAVSLVRITNLTAVMFDGLPTWSHVSVFDAPDATSERAMKLIECSLSVNIGILSYTEIDLESATVNNLSAIRGSAIGSLSPVGNHEKLFTKVVGLIANDRVYTLTLTTPREKQASGEPVFDDIIGSFYPR